MIRRSVVVENPARISASRGQIKIDTEGSSGGSVPAEDLGVLLLESSRTSLTVPTLQTCAKYGTAIITCDERLLPAGIFLPLSGHHAHGRILRAQIESSLPTQKRLWKQIVSAKLANQAKLLESLGLNHVRIARLSREVRSGDPENLEAQGARLYWKELFGRDFRREVGGEGQNAMLNYGYAIVRASLARICVTAGLHPTIGIHHSNQFNAFCLVDDLIEPMRPFVDLVVRELVMDKGSKGVGREEKVALIEVLQRQTSWRKENFALHSAMPRYVRNFVECLSETRKKLDTPVLS